MRHCAKNVVLDEIADGEHEHREARQCDPHAAETRP